MKTVLIIIDYFGEWPKWFQMYLKSCELNPSIRWLIHSDCPIPDRVPANVTFVPISREDYTQRIGDILGVRFRPQSMYKVCDLRPAFGILYEDEIAGYDYFGWGDIDVVYGNIRALYTGEVLTHNVISASDRICTGHLTLLKNEPWLRAAFRHIPHWRERLEDPRPHPWSESLDEARLSGIFSPCEQVRRQFGSADTQLPARYWNNNYFREQWTTPFTPFPWRDGSAQHPEVWFWRNGRLTNQRDADSELLYLHLMNFKAARYINEELYGTALTWDSLSEVLHFNCAELGDETVRIDRSGMHLCSS